MSSDAASRPGNRLAVALSAAALIMSAGFVGAPALAKALNADTVDRKHAVGAKAGLQARKGKLVATDKRTGRLPDDIIATAPRAKQAAHATTATTARSAADSLLLAGRPGSAYLTKAEVDQVIALGGTAALPAVGVTTSRTAFTTSRPGRLLVDFTGSGQLQCPGSSFVRWWLQVDDTPIRSSAMALGEAPTLTFDYHGFPAIHLSGVTAEVVPPGDHQVSLVGGCTSGASSGSTSSGSAGAGTVTVLSAAAAPATAARSASRHEACLSTSSGRTCR